MPDQVHARTWREAREDIVKIFASSSATGNVPKVQTVVNVPFLKKSRRLTHGRLVSLTSGMEHFLEGIPRDRFHQHLDGPVLIRYCQYGFVRGKLCLS